MTMYGLILNGSFEIEKKTLLTETFYLTYAMGCQAY